MSVDSKKTILLEKKYLYVRASLGFQLEGTSTEIIPTNNGFYRFYVDNLSKALGNSYVNILYDSKDLAFQSFCSDLYMDELMSSDSSAIEDVVLELQKNTSKIGEFENGVSSALEANHQDNVAFTAKLEEFESGVSSAMASNHADNVALNSNLKNLFTNSNVSLSVINSFPFGSFDFNKPLSLFCVDDFITNGDTFYCSKSVNYRPGSQGSMFWVNFSFDIPSFETLPSSHIDCTSLFSHYNKNGGYFELTGYSDKNVPFVKDYNRDIMSNPLYVRKICAIVNVPLDIFKFLVFFGHSKKYSKCSFFDKTLSIYPCNGFSCINQDFDFDFDGGHLNLKFYTDVEPSFLNTRTLRFYTDIGYYDFPCSDLNFYKAPVDFNGMLLCSNSPQIGTTGSIKKLFGISCF